jgi:hypothetical protein
VNPTIILVKRLAEEGRDAGNIAEFVGLSELTVAGILGSARQAARRKRPRPARHTAQPAATTLGKIHA